MVKLNLPKTRRYEMPCRHWKRLLAFILDLMIINIIIVSPFRPLLQKLLPSTSMQESIELLYSTPGSTSALITVTIVMALLILLYFIILERRLGQTIGKILFNIYLKPNKGAITFWQALISNLTLIPFFPFILLWVIDPLYLVFGKTNQRLMEQIVGLKLVEEVQAW